MSNEQQFTTQSDASAAKAVLTNVLVPTLEAVEALISDQPSLSSCAVSLRLALRERDAARCEHLARQAGNQHDKEAVAALVDLLQHGSGRRIGRKNPQWLAARVAAAQALGKIGDAPALSALAQAILDRSPHVQRAAGEALLAVGSAAGPHLIARLEQPGNWSLDGMKMLIATLGRLQQPESAVALSRIILGELPLPPLRWKYPLIGTGLIATLGTLLYTVTQLTWVGWAPILGLICVGLMFAPLLVLVCLVIVMPLYNLWKNKEMQALAVVAEEALYAVRDRSVLPVIIAAAFGAQPPKRRQVACKALESLLPLLNEDDTDFFPVTARTYLLLAMGYSGDTLDLALLRAMEFVGNGQAIPAVTRLSKNSAKPLIQQEATRILPILHRRFEQARTSSMLLRASDKPLTQSDQLLRASLVSTEIPAEELLRASLTENESVEVSVELPP